MDYEIHFRFVIKYAVTRGRSGAQCRATEKGGKVLVSASPSAHIDIAECCEGFAIRHNIQTQPQVTCCHRCSLFDCSN